MLNIEYKENLDEEFYKIIDDEFNKFAEKNKVVCNYTPFSFIAKDDEKFVGIITGNSYYKEVHISDLIIIDEYRNKHIGSKLVQTVEEYFKEKGFENINLTTYGFQAPEFYKINRKINKVNNELKQYIEGKILPEYELNDGGHNSEHVKYVLKRAFELADGYEINYDILYTCVCFHDVACHIDRDRHEVLSAERAYEDEYLNGFFSIMEMKTIRETIEDHRASLEYIPRNIYGKILSSADRKVEVKQYLIASISYGKKKNPEIDKNESIESSYKFVIKKFGKNGYAINKSYVEDLKYKKFLEDIQYLIDNKELFIELATFIYDKLYN